MPSLLVLPYRRLLRVPSEETIFSALRTAGIRIPSDCGGQGRCGRCKVRFLEAAPSPTSADSRFLSEEELSAGWRLSCQHRVEHDFTLEVPTLGEVAQVKVRSGEQPIGSLRPQAVQRTVAIPPPSRGDRRADLERLCAALGEEVEVPLSVLAKLPEVLRTGDFQITVTRVGRKVVEVEPGAQAKGPYGLALDIGTTTLAAYLLDLGKGEELLAKALANPQAAFGADVLSRIGYVQEHGQKGLAALKGRLLEAIGQLVESLVGPLGLSPEEIVQAAVVGNPTMMHLFAGVDPSPIGQAPFTPVWKRGMTFQARELGLRMNPEGIVHVLPLVSGYVGADTVAAVLACGLHHAEGLALLLDLGTNGEIVLGGRERMVACSAAAGPAFEGGRIACGMPGVEGAIFRVELNGGVRYQVLGGGEPQGLCGTGLVDAVAVLLSIGLIDPCGRLLSGDGTPFAAHIEGKGNARRFRIEEGKRPIYITQRDIRELQLAKGAIRAGVEVLLSRMGATPEEIDRVYLAGAFGSQMRPESLVQLGLLPEELLPRIVPVGNAAGTGAKLALLDCEALPEAERIAQEMEYVELSYEKPFAKQFVAQMRFPESRKEVRS
ncbi:MAG TPA: DUF4445 domain-containing protein [Candidatus Acetothermia bacterium]|nr:DUF4445 domain-containing protein [Candidatus Acetothermia bacterium]